MRGEPGSHESRRFIVVEYISCALVGRHVDARRYDKAVEFGAEVVSDFPHCPFEHHHLGRAYLSMGMYEDAIRHLEISLEDRSGRLVRFPPR